MLCFSRLLVCLKPKQVSTDQYPANACAAAAGAEYDGLLENIACVGDTASVGGSQVEARAEVEVPEHLISDEHLDQLMLERRPQYVSIGADPEGGPLHPSDNPAEGIIQLRLSNGIRVNARRTLNEPKAAMLRMIAAGEVAVFCVVFMTEELARL